MVPLMRRWFVRYLAMALAATAALLLVIWAVGGLDDMGLSRHGLTALILTVGFTAAMSIGLMGLTFYSGRSGHDETVIDGDGPFDETKRRANSRKLKRDGRG